MHLQTNTGGKGRTRQGPRRGTAAIRVVWRCTMHLFEIAWAKIWRTADRIVYVCIGMRRNSRGWVGPRLVSENDLCERDTNAGWTQVPSSCADLSRLSSKSPHRAVRRRKCMCTVISFIIAIPTSSVFVSVFAGEWYSPQRRIRHRVPWFYPASMLVVARWRGACQRHRSRWCQVDRGCRWRARRNRSRRACRSQRLSCTSWDPVGNPSARRLCRLESAIVQGSPAQGRLARSGVLCADGVANKFTRVSTRSVSPAGTVLFQITVTRWTRSTSIND